MILFVLDIANQTVVAHAISPKPTLVAVKRLTPLPWILRGSQTFAQETNDGLLSGTVELLDLSFSGAGEFNRPDQACAPVLRA